MLSWISFMLNTMVVGGGGLIDMRNEVQDEKMNKGEVKIASMSG